MITDYIHVLKYRIAQCLFALAQWVDPRVKPPAPPKPAEFRLRIRAGTSDEDAQWVVDLETGCNGEVTVANAGGAPPGTTRTWVCDAGDEFHGDIGSRSALREMLEPFGVAATWDENGRMEAAARTVH